ncbi:MAG: hypothetical protein ACP5IK_01890 [Candidatus Micrarchaeia archaeon]
MVQYNKNIVVLLIAAIFVAGIFVYEVSQSGAPHHMLTSTITTTVNESISLSQAKAYAVSFPNKTTNISIGGIHYGFAHGVRFEVTGIAFPNNSTDIYSLVLICNSSSDAQNIFYNYSSFFDKVANTNFAGGTTWIPNLPKIGDMSDGILINEDSPGSLNSTLILQFTFHNVYAKVEITAPRTEVDRLEPEIINVSESLLTTIEQGAFTR